MKIYTYDNKVMTVGGKWMEQPTDPYNPLGLPPFTMRVEFYGDDANLDPSALGDVNGTWTNVSGSIWDWTYQNTDWHYDNSRGAMCYYDDVQFRQYRNICGKYRFNVLGANTAGVTNMANFFRSHKYIQSIALFDTSSVTNMSYFLYANSGSVLTAVPQFDTSKVTDMSYMLFRCEYLTSVPLFDTSSATNTTYMLSQCSRLTSIPLFDTSSMTNVSSMFQRCVSVESGALALYTQMSTQATPPSYHSQTFYSCGTNTTTGAAELAQIPTSWGGTMTE